MIFEFMHQEKAYQFDDERMSLAEARWVKREFGMTGPTLFGAFQELDPDALLAIFALALKRGGVEIETAADIPLGDENENGYFELIQSVKAKTAEAAALKVVRRRNATKV